MMNPTNESNTKSGVRGRIIAVAVLFAMTLAGGLAASGVSPTGWRTSAVEGDALEFRSKKIQGVQLTGRLDRGSVLRGSDGEVRMELVLSADDAQGFAPTRTATDLVVVLDRSGSMGGKPLADAIAAVQELVSRLRDGDRFALVTYASDARLEIPMLTAGEDTRPHWRQRIAAVQAGGGTNMAAGVELATMTVDRDRLADHTPRVILLSDGHANEGDHSPEGLRARAGRAALGEYVLSAVGVGLGFDETLMAALADSGTGNFYYVQDGRDLGDVFAGEFESARETVASAVTVEIEPAPGVELRDAGGYPLERLGGVVRFRPGTLFAGQSRHIWLTLTSPTAITGEQALGDFRMTWREPSSTTRHVARFDRTPTLACVEGEAQFVASLDRDTLVRGIAEDSLAGLKQRVARSVERGRFAEAKDEVRAYKRKNSAAYRQLGLAQSEMPSFEAASDLEEEIAEADKVRSPAAMNALSKKLSAEGNDGRRVGAKK